MLRENWQNSRSLHFGRDDNSVGGINLHTPTAVGGKTLFGINRIVIPTEVEGPAVLPVLTQTLKPIIFLCIYGPTEVGPWYKA
jgi:hypothetical protein